MTDDAELDQIAGEMAQSAKHTFEERREEQAEILDAVREESDALVLEPTCNILADYTVPLKAKMNGELIDRMGSIHEQGTRIEENPEEAFHEVSDVADQMSQLLADAINDPEWSKSLFYQVYREEGFDPLYGMLEEVMDALKAERERKQGVAEGFRKRE